MQSKIIKILNEKKFFKVVLVIYFFIIPRKLVNCLIFTNMYRKPDQINLTISII